MPGTSGNNPRPHRFLQPRSLRVRLILSILGISLLVTAIGFTLIAYSDQQLLRQSMNETIESISKALTQPFARLMLLSDTGTSTEISANLSSFPDVRYAFLYSSNGKTLFSYRRDNLPRIPPPEPGKANTGWSDDVAIHRFVPLTYQGTSLGLAYFQLSNRIEAQWQSAYLRQLLVMIPVLVLIAWFLAARVQRLFTEPLTNLLGTLQKIGETQDYSIRAHTRESSEFGRLYQGFNHFLDLLNQSSQELQDHKQAIDEAAIVSVTDVKGNITYANDKFCEISKYAREELVGQNHRLLKSGVHPPSFYKSMWKVLARGQVWRGEICNTDKEDNYYWVDSTIMPLLGKNGKPDRYIAIRYPITERKNLEIELASQKESLEVMVRKRTQELHESQAQLIEAEKLAALGGLVAGIAHEINTPVGVGVTAASHLQDETQRILEAVESGSVTRSGLKTYLDHVGESSTIMLSNLERAANLIHSFKRVASDQSNHERHQFDLAHYLDEIMLSLHPQLKHKPYEVSVDCPDDIQMDSYPGALSQIITNLVTNSLRYGFEGRDSGNIHLKVVPQTDQTIVMHYSDDGNGVDPSALSHLFEPFYTTGRGKGGTGIGLHIVYNLVVTTLEGKINVESPPGSGLSYRLTLPVKVSDAA